jgi:predicted nucleic acid-binding protein
MPEVITNTTPVQYLHQIGRLDLLPRFYGQIIIPEPVANELAEGRRLGVDLPDIGAMRWISVVPVPTTSTTFPPRIHQGEAGAILLAQSYADPLLLMDDRLARDYARHLGMRVTGTLGVLIRAKREGAFPHLKTVLLQLETAGFRLNPPTFTHCLEQAGEPSS